MTRFKEITQIILFTQILLVQSQWFDPGSYESYGYPYGAVPPPYYEALSPYQPEETEIPTNSNPPNIIIIKDEDDKPTKKDKFRFEEILTLLLTRRLGRDRDREREAPPPQQSNQGNCECCCCCCCCKNRNNENGNNRCSCCNDQNNNERSNRSGGGTTVHITIVLPNNSVNKKNDSK